MPQRITLAEADALEGVEATTVRLRHQAWRAGKLSWMLHNGKDDPEKGQKAAYRLSHSTDSRIIVYDIARRWGKSLMFAIEASETCLQIPKARVPYACGTVTSLREFIIPHFQAIIATAPEDMKPEIVGDEVRFKNGSRVVFAACEDKAKAERLRGPKSHKIIVDEAGFIPVLSYVVDSVLLFQLAGTNGKLLMGSSPPDSPSHPFVEYYKRAEAAGAAMTATIYDAPHLTETDLDELCFAAGGYDSVVWQREGLAKFLTDPTKALVPEFTAHEAQLVQAHTPVIPSGYDKPALDRYIVGDLGFVDLAFVLFAEWDFPGAMLSIVNEWSEARQTTDVLQREVDRVAKETWGDAPIYRRIIDATARERADLTKLQEDDPTAENAWRAAKNAEREAAVNQLRIATGRLRYRVHPRCVKLIRHLKHGVWNDKRTSFDRAEGYGHFDGVAAMMYMIRHLDSSHNPTPPLRPTHFSQIVPGGVPLPPGSDADRRLRLANAFRRPHKS